MSRELRRGSIGQGLLVLAALLLSSRASAQDCAVVEDPCKPRIVHCEYGRSGRGHTVREMQVELDDDGCGLKAGILTSANDRDSDVPTEEELDMSIAANGNHFKKGKLAMGDYVGVVLDPFRGDQGFVGAEGFPWGVFALGVVAGAAVLVGVWYLSLRSRRG